MNKVYLIILLLILFVIIVVFVSYINYKEPNIVKLEGLKCTEIKLKEQIFEIKCLMNNENWFPVSVNYLELELKSKDKKLGKIQTSNFYIGPFSQIELNLNFTTSVPKLLLLSPIFIQDTIEIKAEGVVSISLLFQNFIHPKNKSFIIKPKLELKNLIERFYL